MADAFIVRQRLKFGLILTFVLFCFALFAFWHFGNEQNPALDDSAYRMAAAASIGLGLASFSLLIIYLFSCRTGQDRVLTDWVDSVPWRAIGVLALLPTIGLVIWLLFQYGAAEDDVFQLLSRRREGQLQSRVFKEPQLLTQQNAQRHTLLQEAYLAADAEMTALLLKLGAPKQQLAALGYDPIMQSFSNLPMLGVLLKAGFDPNQPDSAGWSPLHYAVDGQSTNVVQLLLEHGADVDRRDPVSRTALMKAVENGNAVMARLLLEGRAKPDLFDQKGEAALHKAVRRKDAEIVTLLLKYDADPALLNLAGEAAIHLAARIGDIELIEVLAAVPGQVDLPDEAGQRPLGHALEEWQFEAAEVLLEQGADINGALKDGSTLLHRHLKQKDYRTVRFLINQGADVNLPDAGGETALELIRRKELQGLIEMIEQRSEKE